MFKLKENQTTVSLEIGAGLTIFCAMVYCLAVNPAILSAAGAPPDALFTATALAAIIGTVIMAFVANLPFAVAPAMGINAFFAFVVVKTMGYTWPQAVTAVLISGVLFLLLSLSPLRAKMLKELPASLQYAVCGGVGLLISGIGLINSKVVVMNGGLPGLGSIQDPSVQLVFIGLFITAFLLALKFRYAILVGIIISTIIGIPLGVTTIPDGNQIFSLPPSPGPLFMDFDFSLIWAPDFWSIILVFLFIAIFNSLAGFLSLFSIMGENESIKNSPRMGRAFIADSLAVIGTGFLGISPNTAYGESGTGIALGGRTGLASLVCAAGFAVAMFCSPLFLSIPFAAVAPALLVVGWYMISPLALIDFNDPTESFPSIIVLVLIGLSWKIADSFGIAWLVYILMKLASGRGKELNATIYFVGAIFLSKIIWDLVG